MRNVFLVFGPLTASLLGSLSLSGVSLAQHNAQPASVSKEEALSETARGLFQQGVKAYGQRQWERCRAAFLAAWNIKHHPQIAGNLAGCEATLGLYREAAEHARYFLRETPKDTPAEHRREVEAILKEMLTKVASVVVSTNILDAELVIDGIPVGRSPLAESVFLEPGLHRFEVRFAGYPTAQQAIEISPGAPQEVKLELKAPVLKQADSVQTQPEAVQPPAKVEHPNSSERRNVVPFVVGTAAAAVGTGLGIGFALHSNALSRNANEISMDLQAVGGIRACFLPALASQCSEFRETFKDKGSFRNAAIVSFVAGGLVGATTVAYALWPNARDKKPGVKAGASVGPGGGRMVIVGQF